MTNIMSHVIFSCPFFLVHTLVLFRKVLRQHCTRLLSDLMKVYIRGAVFCIVYIALIKALPDGV